MLMKIVKEIRMPKILLVEDNELNRDMLLRRLERRGFEVIVAVNGQEGVEKAFSESPDLILMDISLPILDGWEASAKIREMQEDIPIIALTAHAMAADKEKAFSVGCNDFDTKPVDLPRLLEKIESCLNHCN